MTNATLRNEESCKWTDNEIYIERVRSRLNYSSLGKTEMSLAFTHGFQYSKKRSIIIISEKLFCLEFFDFSF